ncbi:MAG: hypothetical protein R2827_05415 [Bdellovibrionales bacterium]
MKKLKTLAVACLLTLGFAKSALADNCNDLCDTFITGQASVDFFFEWYYTHPSDRYDTFLSSYIFYSQDRTEWNSPPPLGAVVYDNGLVYTQNEFEDWYESTGKMIDDAINSVELEPIWDMLAYAAVEVDSIFHFAGVLNLAIDADHPSADDLTIGIIAANNYYLNGGALSFSKGVHQEVEYREFICNLGSDACPTVITNKNDYYSNNRYGISYESAAVFFEQDRSESVTIITNQEPFHQPFSSGVPYLEEELVDFLSSITDMHINGMDSATRTEVEAALAFAGTEVDTVEHFAKVLGTALDFGIITLPTGFTPQAEESVAQGLAEGIIHPAIYDWALEIAEFHNVDVYSSYYGMLLDVSLQ